MGMELNELIEKAKFYFEKQVTIHIDTIDNRFFNGIITQISEKHIVVNDRVLGETIIFFSEIKVFERFVGRGT